MPITGYYDGTAVRTDAQFEMNQRVLIVPVSDNFFDANAVLRYVLHDIDDQYEVVLTFDKKLI